MPSPELYAVTLEQRYRSLFEESRDAVYITARDGRFLDVNRSFLEMFGFTREELLRKNAADLYVDPGARQRFQHEVELRNAVRDYEVRFRRRDGSVIHALLSAAACRNESGQVLWYQGIIHDFSAQKEAEDALARSEHFARTIVSSVGEGVIVYDRELRYQVWNRFMEELTGIKSDAIVGKYALASFPHLKEYGIDTLLERALAGERVRSEDTPYRVPETGRD